MGKSQILDRICLNKRVGGGAGCVCVVRVEYHFQ